MEKTTIIKNINRTHILVIRLSSMGDVALTIPVLQAVVTQNPNVKITVWTKKAFAPIFHIIPNLEIFTPDLKKEYKGVLGLFRLYKGMRNTRKFDMIIDLHDVLRSNILSSFFRLNRNHPTRHFVGTTPAL